MQALPSVFRREVHPAAPPKGLERASLKGRAGVANAGARLVSRVRPRVRGLMLRVQPQETRRHRAGPVNRGAVQAAIVAGAVQAVADREVRAVRVGRKAVRVAVPRVAPGVQVRKPERRCARLSGSPGPWRPGSAEMLPASEPIGYNLQVLGIQQAAC